MSRQSTRGWLSFAIFGSGFTGAAAAAVAMAFQTHSVGIVPHISFGVAVFLFFLLPYAVLQSSNRPFGFILTGVGILVGGPLWAILSQPTSFTAAALVIGCLLAGTSRKAELIHAELTKSKPRARDSITETVETVEAEQS